MKVSMTIKGFNDLSHDDRLFTVVDKGTFLDNYITKEIKINLYTVDMFYVELVYDGDQNRIIEVRIFKSGPELEKYSGSISF